MAKVRISVTLDKEFVEWLDEKVENKIFGSRSHGVALALKTLRESDQQRLGEPRKRG